ncbi:MAG: tripartite tricarboxylate transporter permease [Chloroflexota bacterium]
MDTLQSLMNGFAIAFLPENLLFALLGCIWGTAVGVLPGIGPIAGMAILLPLTFHLPATGAIIMLAAIYYGAMYGGTITSVLLNVPGEVASAITCIDGHQMAKNGRAGVALSVAAVGSFIGGTLATVGLVLAARPLAAIGLQFGPPELFALMVLGTSLLTGLAGKSITKALLSGVFGLALAAPGLDPMQGVPRLTFGQMELMEGVAFVPVLMGLFGIGEILINAENPSAASVTGKLTSLIPTRKDVKDSGWPVLRGSAIGFALGLIPGIGSLIPTMLSYVTEKRMSKYPEKFGTGVVEGVAAPETANNAHANAALIPLFTLGIPGSPTIAVLMGAFLMNGLTPGPFLFRDHADLVWAIIASMYVGNVMLLVLNLPLIGIWVSVLKIPYSILFPMVLVFTLVGAYSIRGTIFDIGLMVLFGVIGYLLRKLDMPVAPMALTLVLGPAIERNLRGSLVLSGGDLSILFRTPISTGLLLVTVIFLVTTSFRLFPSTSRLAGEGVAAGEAKAGAPSTGATTPSHRDP